MGGNQSWLACDTTYPVEDSQEPPQEVEEASLLLAVIILLITVLSVFTATCIGHCLFIHFRSRGRRRRSSSVTRGVMSAGAVGLDARKASLGATGAAGSATTLVVVTELQSVSEESGDEVDDDDEEEEFSDSDVDSVTERDMRQMAQIRRQSRYSGIQLPPPNIGIQDQRGAEGASGMQLQPLGYENRGFE